MKIIKEKMSDRLEKATGIIDLHALKNTDPEIHDILMKSFEVRNAALIYLDAFKALEEKKEEGIAVDMLRIYVILKKNAYLLKDSHESIDSFTSQIEDILKDMDVKIPTVVHEDPKYTSSSEMH